MLQTLYYTMTANQTIMDHICSCMYMCIQLPNIYYIAIVTQISKLNMLSSLIYVSALLKEMCSITHGELFLKCNLNRERTAMLFTEDFWE